MTAEIIVDVDVHQTWASDGEIERHVSEAWRPYFRRQPKSGPYGKYGRYHPPHIRFPQITGGAMRPEATPRVGGPAGSHFETLMEQHVVPNGITRALLTWGYGLHAGYLNAGACVELCRAANDYLAETWLHPGGGRLRGTISVPVPVPDEAAKEICRLGRDPLFSAVLLVANPFSKPFGHPVYHPIYAAAEAMGLPVVTHVGSESVTKGTWNAGGVPTTKAEYYTLLEQPGPHHLSSMICEGVFEKFPRLKVLFNEFGSAWLPWLMWGLDSRYAGLRVENPMLRRLPSEYLREHVWFSTQPFAGEADNRKVLRMLDIFGGMRERLCFSSDYPHWDTEEPRHIRPRLPTEWRADVMGGNACRLLGWSEHELQAEADRHAAASAVAAA